MIRMTGIARALTIAGSDSGGCAGIQADLKTFAALGVHGMSAVTVVTAQDTRRVHHIAPVSLENIRLQICSALEDIGADAVKTGMLYSRQVIELVAQLVQTQQIDRLVVDPVMMSTAGDLLIQEDARQALITLLFPRALVVTPNRFEAESLTGLQIGTAADLEKAARRIHELGARHVVVKGGHLENDPEAVDCFFDGRQVSFLRSPRVPTRHTHGSGCTFASAIAAGLAQGLSLAEALRQAKEFVTQALRHALPLGKGRGPLGHFYAFWPVKRKD